MRRNLIFLMAIITFGLTMLIAYQIMVQGNFPWLFLFALLIVSLISLYAFVLLFFSGQRRQDYPHLLNFNWGVLKQHRLP